MQKPIYVTQPYLLPLMDYIEAIEIAVGTTAQKNCLQLQPGAVPATAANSDEFDAWVGFKPDTVVRTEVARFVEWYAAITARNHPAVSDNDHQATTQIAWAQR